MRWCWFLCSVLLAGLWSGCHRNGDGAGADPGPVDCDLTRTAQCVAGPLAIRPCTGDPIELGAHCDDIFICVADEGEARALMDAASELTCAAGPGEPAMCGADGWACQWISPRTIDDAELAAICAVTILPIPVQVACMVYV